MRYWGSPLTGGSLASFPEMCATFFEMPKIQQLQITRTRFSMQRLGKSSEESFPNRTSVSSGDALYFRRNRSDKTADQETNATSLF